MTGTLQGYTDVEEARERKTKMSTSQENSVTALAKAFEDLNRVSRKFKHQNISINREEGSCFIFCLQVNLWQRKERREETKSVTKDTFPKASGGVLDEASSSLGITASCACCL